MEAIENLSPRYLESSILLEKETSFYQHKTAKKASNLTIIEVLHSIQQGKYIKEVSKIRDLVASQRIDESKILKSRLPAVTFSGLFKNGHQKSNLYYYNNIIVFDIDKMSKQEVDSIYQKLSKDEYIISHWLSPSGNGIKGLVYIVYSHCITLKEIHTYHKAAFKKLQEYFLKQYQIELDSSGNDTSRLCYLSYDPLLRIKNKFKPFIYNESIESFSPPPNSRSRKKKIINNNEQNIYSISKYFLNPEGKNKPQHREILNTLIRFLRKKHLSITENYEQWFRVAFAIANTFSCDIGLKYYLQLCELDGIRFDEIGSRKILKYCYENSNGDITFATILFYAQKVGFKTG